MLLSSRRNQNFKRKLLVGFIATCCVSPVDLLMQCAAKEASGTEETELVLRPARPFDAEPDAASADDGKSSQALPFRKPAIPETKPAETKSSDRGVKVPAKTVSNRVSSAPTPGRGWVARNAVNLDQPLRDPGDQPDTRHAITSDSNAAVQRGATGVRRPLHTNSKPRTGVTVSPLPSYIGDQPQRKLSEQVSKSPGLRAATSPETAAMTSPKTSKPVSPKTSKTASPTTSATTSQKPRDKVRPSLVLPKDRLPSIPSTPTRLQPKQHVQHQELAKPKSAPPEKVVAKKSEPAPESLIEKSTSPAPEVDASTDSSRADRILDQLLPADGTAIGTVQAPKKSTVSEKKKSSPKPQQMQLQGPAESDSADSPAEETPERIASSKVDPIVIRKLRIDEDGSDVGASSRKKPSQMQVVEQDPDGTARSYSGDLELERAPTSSAATDRDRNEEAAPPAAPAAPLDYTGRPTEQRQVSYPIRRLQPGIARVLNHFYHRPEVADGRSNWGMLHSIMVYGVDTRVQVGRRTYSAIAWLAGNNVCRGQRLAESTENGIRIKSGVGLQGHQAQMLAVFSLCGVPLDYPIYADGKQYSIADVLRAEMDACKSGEELTFTLIALSHYLDSDETWIADDGQTWSVERLIREELSQPIVGAACGGTHRLMGFTHALRNRRLQGKPITGQWARAEAFTQDFIKYAYQLQNRDGSMSTNWFEGREDNGNMDRKIQTTGHIVEWLLTVTPDSQLEDPRLVRAVRYLLSAMHNDLNHDFSIGPKGHALRSLAMYHQRVFGSSPWQSAAVAARRGNSSSR